MQPQELTKKGNVIRIARQGAELTQGELAAKAKINRSKLSLYEQGMIDLTNAELERVWKILNAAPRRYGTLSQLAGDPVKWKKALSDVGQRSASEKYSRGLLRKQARVSQQELSRLTGIARSKLSAWESRNAQLSDAEFEKVMDVLLDRVKRDPYWELEQTHEVAQELWKNNVEMRKQVLALEEKNAALAKEVMAQAKEIAALRGWYDAMEKAALAHAQVEEASEEKPARIDEAIKKEHEE